LYGLLFGFLFQAVLSVLQEKMTTCPFEEEDGQFCPGVWHVVTLSDGSRPFVGCTKWKPGDPRTCDGGHNAAYIRDGVDSVLLEMYRTEGAPNNTVADGSCTFIAPQCYKGKGCDRHGGLETPLERAGFSSCTVRARLLYPRVISDTSSIRVILLLYGTHNHVYHVCKPLSAAIADAIEALPSASIRKLQVRVAYFFYLLAKSALLVLLFAALAWKFSLDSSH